jgi:hypothetical protein
MSNVAPLIPLVIEAGVDGIWIGQASHLTDYTALRREYPRLLLVGGIDADVLSKNKQAIRAEVTSKVPSLLRAGRYFPTIDDNPRENIPYENYEFYREVLREVCEA